MSSAQSQLRVKVVRVLCDGCERGVADVYCAHCAKGACKRCKQTLHTGAACANSFDLARCAAVLALCQVCRTRPAQRYRNSEVFPLCHECRSVYRPPQTKPDGDVLKRALAAELSSSRSRLQKKSPSRRPRATKKSSKHRHDSSSDDTTEGDMTGSAFSRESSAD